MQNRDNIYTLHFLQSGDSSELAPRLPCKGKSVRNRGVSQTMPFLVIPRSLLRGGFIIWIGNAAAVLCGHWGAVTWRAREVGDSRTAIYNHAQRVTQAVVNE